MRCTGSAALVETQFGESGQGVSRPSTTPRFSGFLAKALKTPSETTGASTQAAIEKRITRFQERFMMTVSHLTVSLEQRGLDILAELRLTGIVPKLCLTAWHFPRKAPTFRPPDAGKGGTKSISSV